MNHTTYILFTKTRNNRKPRNPLYKYLVLDIQWKIGYHLDHRKPKYPFQVQDVDNMAIFKESFLCSFQGYWNDYAEEITKTLDGSEYK